MTNVLVTAACNAGCEFCFARSLMAPATRVHMTIDRFERLLELICDCGGSEVRLAGGEPTLHPELATLVTMAEARGLHLTVLSNGLMPEPAIDRLARLPEDQCSVLINWNSAARGAGSPRLQEVLRRLGARAALGCTIDRVPFDLEPLLELLASQPTVAGWLRVGMAHPMIGASNRHLHPKQYPAVGRLLAKLARRATSLGTRLVLDCGFVRCQLDDDAVAALNDNGADTRFECRPIVDISPNGQTAVHCLATADRFTIPLDGSLTALRSLMTSQRQAYDSLGVYRDCATCSWRANGECDGGCLVHRLARLQPVPELELPKEVTS
jgi:hypothetical protein